MNTFPKPSNSLLTSEEKSFLDTVPQNGLKALLLAGEDTHEYSFTHVHADMSGVSKFVFSGDRAQAVRDYFEMQIYYGLRKDPR